MPLKVQVPHAVLRTTRSSALVCLVPGFEDKLALVDEELDTFEIDTVIRAWTRLLTAGSADSNLADTAYLGLRNNRSSTGKAAEYNSALSDRLTQLQAAGRVAPTAQRQQLADPLYTAISYLVEYLRSAPSEADFLRDDPAQAIADRASTVPPSNEPSEMAGVELERLTVVVGVTKCICCGSSTSDHKFKPSGQGLAPGKRLWAYRDRGVAVIELYLKECTSCRTMFYPQTYVPGSSVQLSGCANATGALCLELRVAVFDFSSLFMLPGRFTSVVWSFSIVLGPALVATPLASSHAHYGLQLHSAAMRSKHTLCKC